MIRNYFTIAFRSLSRRKIYTLINVIGLSIAMATASFISTWVLDELSFDKFHPKADRIFRVAAKVKLKDTSWEQAITSVPFGPAISAYYPEVENTVRFDVNDAIVEYENQKFSEEDIILTDPSFFDIFSFELSKGNAITCLQAPYTVVLSQSMADKYFGDEEPIGKTLRLYLYDPNGRGADYEVTGVIEDAPHNSHFRFNFLVSFSTLQKARPDRQDDWFDNGYYTYLLLSSSADWKTFESKIPEFVDHYMGENMAKYNVYFEYFLQPITEIYHRSDLVYEFYSGNYELIWIFSIIGLFILTLAGINYMNLAVAFSFERMKEVGVRKVLGAFKSQLLRQHLIETVILLLLSIILAGLLVEVLKTYFYNLTDKTYLTFPWTTLTVQLCSFSGLLLLFAGIFPAQVLAGLRPIKALKSQISRGKGKFGIWKLLVTFQFTVTLAILVGLFVVQDQLTFVRSKDLGYDKSNLLILRVNGNQDVKDGFEAFRNDMVQASSTTAIARSNSMIVGGLDNSNGTISDDMGNVRTEMLYNLSTDHDFLNTYKVTLVAGRDFSKSIHSDSTEAFIINEKAVKAFGWTNPDQAIGQRIDFSGRMGQIIGVTKDFHFNSLHHTINPMCMFLSSGNFSRISIRGNDNNELLAQAKYQWNRHFPDALFDYTFQEEALTSKYRSEQRFNQIFNVSALVSIIIALLGLFGLVGFTVNKKTKEIGLRKVLGASTVQVLILTSKDFLSLILFAAFIAFPSAWWLMERWLMDFPFRTSIKPWVFVLSGLTVFGLSIIVVIAQTSSAATANPIDSLKEE